MYLRCYFYLKNQNKASEANGQNVNIDPFFMKGKGSVLLSLLLTMLEIFHRKTVKPTYTAWCTKELSHCR